MQDLKGSVSRIAQFLEKSLDAEVIEKIADHCLFKNMKKNNMSNYSTVPKEFLDQTKTKFLRKGVFLCKYICISCIRVTLSVFVRHLNEWNVNGEWLQIKYNVTVHRAAIVFLESKITNVNWKLGNNYANHFLVLLWSSCMLCFRNCRRLEKPTYRSRSRVLWCNLQG